MKNYQHTYCFKSRRTFSLSALKKKYLNAHLLDYLQKSEKPKCFELRSSIWLIKHGRVDLNHILATRGLVLLSSSCYTRKEKAGNLHGVGALQAATWAVSVTHSTPGPAFLSLVQSLRARPLCFSGNSGDVASAIPLTRHRSPDPCASLLPEVTQSNQNTAPTLTAVFL